MLKNLVKKIFRLGEADNTGPGFAAWAPPARLMEYEKEFVIHIEIPEVNKDDVKVKLENGVLSVIGRRKADKEERNKRHRRVVSYYDQFTRAFKMPDNIVDDKVSASFKDGILKVLLQKQQITIPKVAEVKIL